MVATAIQEELLKRLEQLAPEMQRRVLDFATALVLSKPKGTPAADLLRFAGTIGPEDARQMTEAIEAECERIDPNEW